MVSDGEVLISEGALTSRTPMPKPKSLILSRFAVGIDSRLHQRREPWELRSSFPGLGGLHPQTPTFPLKPKINIIINVTKQVQVHASRQRL